MTTDQHLEYMNVAANLVATHIPSMGYRVPSEGEKFHEGNTLVDGDSSGAVDMLSPTLRTQFEDVLGDACHLLSMAFKRAGQEAIEDDVEEPEKPDDEEETDMEIGGEHA